MALSWFRRLIHHFLYSVWKKRPILLATILVFTVIFVVFQYNSVTKEGKSASASSREHLYGIRPVGASDPGESGSPMRPMPKRNLSALEQQRPSTGFGNLWSGLQSGDNNRNFGNSMGQQNLRVGNEEVDQKPGNRDLNSSPNYNVEGRYPGNDDKFFANIHKDQTGRKDLPQVVPEIRNPVPNLRLVHLDLKGAPPKISYFKQIFPLLKEAGANGIMIEYEEMFPFWGSIESISSKESYTKDDIRAILDLAKIHAFEVIPLVQTFGHLEFVLKLPEYRHLREVDLYPMALCPSKNDSFSLVTMIIDQVMMLHPSIKWLHIGCDEVYHMGYCDKCRLRDRDTIYVDHVTRVARYVRDKFNVVPIIWDDMLRNMGPDKMRQLGPLVEPMVWTYVRDVYRFIPYSTWMAFSDVFPHVWAASAFKGAFGETLTVPNIKMHLENNQAWLEVIAEQEKNFKSFRGIAITGWQRYDHLANLCELLPAALPSLILNLITVSRGKFENIPVFKKFDSIMQCANPPRSYYSSMVGGGGEVDLDHDTFLWQKASSCQFPGVGAFKLTEHTADAVKRTDDYIYDVTVHKAWMTEYNVRHNISNPHRIEEGLQEHSAVYYMLTSLVREAEDSLKECFDRFTVYEWIEQNIYPSLLKMEKLMKNAIELKKAGTWPKRPLPILEDLKRFIHDNAQD